jgi:hypothetical protein
VPPLAPLAIPPLELPAVTLPAVPTPPTEPEGVSGVLLLQPEAASMNAPTSKRAEILDIRGISQLVRETQSLSQLVQPFQVFFVPLTGCQVAGREYGLAIELRGTLILRVLVAPRRRIR